MKWRLVLGAVGVALLLAVGAWINNDDVNEDDAGHAPNADPEREDTVAFADEFDGGELDTDVWATCHWWADDGCSLLTNEELEWYVPEQVIVADGAAHLVADRRDVVGHEGRTFPYVSGMITSRESFSFTYGTVEARLDLPAGQGLWSAFWLLPASLEERPEIDIVEMLGQDPGTAYTSLHAPGQRTTVSHEVADLSEGWHTYALEWGPGRLRFRIDGREVWSRSGEDVPGEPMYLVLNLAVGGAWPGDPGPDTSFPAEMLVDYVRVSGI